MTDLFNDPQMAAYIYQTSEEHQGTVLSESEIRQLITQRWLKTCSEVRCRLCKNSTETDSLVFQSHYGSQLQTIGQHVLSHIQQYLYSSFVRFTLINTLGKHVTSVEKSAMTDKQNKNPPQSISTLMVTKVVIIDHDLTLDEHGEEQHSPGSSGCTDLNHSNLTNCPDYLTINCSCRQPFLQCFIYSAFCLVSLWQI